MRMCMHLRECCVRLFGWVCVCVYMSLYECVMLCVCVCVSVRLCEILCVRLCAR